MKFTILIASIFLFTNGARDFEPWDTYQYNRPFDTARACETFRNSPEVEDELAKLAEYLSDTLAGHKFAIETECRTVEGRSAAE